MDLAKYLKTVNNLNKYIYFTWDLQNKRIDLKIPFNISTILSLKDIRSIEIEYFNKCEENGGATKIVELLLHSPPSKTWSLLGGELICLLQYWLEAIRKHLILHNIHWWTFLKLILKYIKYYSKSGNKSSLKYDSLLSNGPLHILLGFDVIIISAKDVSLNKILIEETAECLLDLATHNIPDAKQRNELIQIFNIISAEASRSVRLANKRKLQEYFVKLSTLLATSGDLPLQHRILESLLRWLLPRHEPAVRQAAADKWFPEGVYSRHAVNIFLDRPWQDFMKDARDFLNAQNDYNGLVASFICKAFSVGYRVCFSAKYIKECWLDLNSTTKCMSILIDAKLWDALGGDGSHDAVLIYNDNTSHVELKQECRRVVITATVFELSRVYPFSSDVIGDTNIASDIHISVANSSDICRLDKSLRDIFGGKYKTSLDIENVQLSLSPDGKLSSSDVINGTEEETRFSMPAEVSRRKRSGYIVKPRNPGSWNSPSTVSTSSLAQLHDKLAALPRFTFDKEPVSVCALPQLSTVSEACETEESHTNNSSLSANKCRKYGVCYKRTNKTDSKTSNSTSDDSNERRNLSPVVNEDENSISCLLVATIGSAGDSVINDTIRRLPNNIPCNTDNIIDLLAQEALEVDTARHNFEDNTRGSKKTSDVQQNKLVITETSVCITDNGMLNEQRLIDESSNDIVENTPVSWVQERFKLKKNKSNSKSNALHIDEPNSVELVHNIDHVEDFFTQHMTENGNGEIVISPSLARKINQTSSECSDEWSDGLGQCILKEVKDHKYIVQDNELDPLFIPGTDVVECVNAMLDKVCQDLDKCTEDIEVADKLKKVNNPLAKSSLRIITRNRAAKERNYHSYKSNAKDDIMKPKFQLSNLSKPKDTKKKPLSRKKTSQSIKKNKKEPSFTIMSPIIERESDDVVIKNVVSPMKSPQSEMTMPLLRRKRKLYSPKDEKCHETSNVQLIEMNKDETAKNSVSKVSCKAPNSIATCYKELEKERQKRIRKPRNRLSAQKLDMPISPRTLQMNQIFDSLKDVIDGEPVKLADKIQLGNDMAVYNYTSDSDDGDERKNKTNSVSKKAFSPTTDNDRSILIGRSSKNVSKSIKTTETTENKSKKSEKRTRQLRIKKPTVKHVKENVSKISEQLERNLDDERMRETVPGILNTSLDTKFSKDVEEFSDKHPDLLLNVVPEMEYVTEDSIILEDQNTKQQKYKTKRILSLKRNKKSPKVNLDQHRADDDVTVSPLPGLLVETALTTPFDINDSVSINMFQKFKDIYEGKLVTGSEVNTTQNLLSDTNEPINYSSSNLNVTEELYKGSERNQKEAFRKNTKKKIEAIKNVKKNNIEQIKIERKSQVCKTYTDEESNVIALSPSEDNSEKSMATMGHSNSPITAHGDFDEDPPNSTLLTEQIQPRIVEQEYLSHSIKNFFTKLTEQLNESNKVDVETLSCSSSKSGTMKSPVVVITRLSPEYIKPGVSVDSRLIDINNSKRHLNFDSSPKTRDENLQSNVDNRNNAEESDKTSTKIEVAAARKSIISPIKLRDGLEFESGRISPRSEREDNFVRHIKSMFCSKKQDTIKSNSTPVEINKTLFSRRTFEQSIVTSSPISSKQSPQELCREESNTDLANSYKAIKRKSSPILGTLKKSKYREANNNFGCNITESGPSLSSVNEWFKRDEPSFTVSAENINLSVKEYLNSVLEKLDTTLIEIHHNTSKRFINMFVDATTQLNDKKVKRERLLREAASEIMSSVVKIMDDKMLSLNAKYESMDVEFMETLKKRAHDLIRDECKQKRAMVTLLREDVQSVLDHIEKAKRPY